jgi:hypothetical protein
VLQSRRTPDGPVIGHSIDNLIFWDGRRWWIMRVTIAEIRPDHTAQGISTLKI